ncbi:CopM family metallochaperone [Pseudomonas oryzihabitans]|uniref:CopM family metallochaperone n=1 Tax=Pseudomonas oryzihabitans TaxID=47885 RepID=UPI003F97FE82
MRIVLSSTLLALALLASGVAQAAETQHPAHQDMQKSMETMHQGMEEGLKAKDPDLAFAKGMLAHHEGAVDMARYQLQHGKDPEMRKLAEDIIQAQQKEIDQLNRWITAHGK